MAHLALAAARILARPAALIFRLGFLAGFIANFVPLNFAQRALAAAEILALPAALSLRFFFGTARATEWFEEPNSRCSSDSSD